MAFLQENLPPINDDQNESSDEEFERKINDPNALRKGIIVCELQKIKLFYLGELKFYIFFIFFEFQIKKRMVTR